MTGKTIAAVTSAGFYPPFVNATDQGDGTVQVTIRANPTNPDGVVGREKCGDTLSTVITLTEWQQFVVAALQPED